MSNYPFQKSEDDWRKELTAAEYRVLREKGTEPPFSGEYDGMKSKGMYFCRACGNELFSSDTKFDSGTGWPSFYAPAKEEDVEMHEDNAYGMERTEVVCSRCGSHLGHVFDDGPKPTGKRFCMNSVSLKFKSKS